MYLVENCARKRLQEEHVTEADATAAAEGWQTAESILDLPSLDGLDPPKPLTTRYRQVLFFRETTLLNTHVMAHLWALALLKIFDKNIN